MNAILIAKLKEGFEEDPITGCHLWNKGIEKDGYGYLTYKGKQYRAHRLAFKLLVGPVADGVLVLHKCNVRACINTAHLYAGTALDNSRDMKEAGNGVYETGRFNWNTKLTSVQVLEIREHLKAKKVLAKIAHLYGVGTTTIRAIKIGRTWKELV